MHNAWKFPKEEQTQIQLLLARDAATQELWNSRIDAGSRSWSAGGARLLVPADAGRQDRKLVRALVGGGAAKAAAAVFLTLVLMEAVLLSCCALIKPWRDGGREEMKRDDGW